MKEINFLLAGLLASLEMGSGHACGIKWQHRNLTDAQEAANRFNTRRPDAHPRDPYPCAWCLYWHIGKRKTSNHIYRLAADRRRKHERAIAADAAGQGDAHVQDGQGPPVLGAEEGPVEPEVPPGDRGGPRLVVEEDVGRPWLLVLQPEESVGLGTKCGTGGMEAGATQIAEGRQQ